jgi:hypothetical protein
VSFDVTLALCLYMLEKLGQELAHYTEGIVDVLER